MTVTSRAEAHEPRVRRPAGPVPRARGRALPPVPPPPSSSRIVGLDGLRAFAVLAVVVYHLAPGVLPGGFLGVDVFFVVSGFLITTLLLREVATRGRLDLPRFWTRRARRLLPALGVVVVTSVLAARIIEPDLLVGIGRQVLGAATFTSNWLEIAAGSSYFDETSPVLFQTFWSLAIEEQFYLVWPVALAILLALGLSRRARAGVVLAGAVASALLMALLVVPGADPTRVYFGTDTHLVGLLLGAAAALWLQGRTPGASTGVRVLDRAAVRRWAPPVALGILAALMLVLDAASVWTYRGGIALGSVLALVAVLGCLAPDSPYARRLESRPLVWVGERSYGLYLWHWPVILLVQAVVGAEPGTLAWWRGTVVAAGVTTVLAWASYRWVETPVRRDGFVRTGARVRTACSLHGRGARVAVGAVALAVVLAGVVVVTAPTESRAQQSVEQGLAAIAGRDGDGRAAKPPEGSAPEPSTTIAPGTIDGSAISAFGDSVLSGAAPAVLDRFPGISIDAKPIRKWLDVPALVEKADRAGTLRDVVVLNFGTNGGFQFEGSEDAMRSVLDTLGPDRDVLVLTTVGISRWVPAANKELAAVVADYPNARVVDWNAAVRSKPGLLHADRTHPNMDGIVVYADVLEKALAKTAAAG